MDINDQFSLPVTKDKFIHGNVYKLNENDHKNRTFISILKSYGYNFSIVLYMVAERHLICDAQKNKSAASLKQQCFALCDI